MALAVPDSSRLPILRYCAAAIRSVDFYFPIYRPQRHSLIECRPLSVSFEGYHRIEARSKSTCRSKRLRQAMQEDVILFSDPYDSAMRCDSNRHPTLQSVWVTLCKGFKPSQWPVED